MARHCDRERNATIENRRTKEKMERKEREVGRNRIEKKKKKLSYKKDKNDK